MRVDSNLVDASRTDRHGLAPVAPSSLNGDLTAALTDTFRANRQAIYGLARRICGDDAAADVTQEVFLRVWKRPDLFDADRGSMRQYLLTLTRGVSIDHLRREVARRARDLRQILTETNPSGDSSQGILDGESATRVMSALGELTHSERDAIVAAFYDDMTYREVASRLGIPEGTAKSRIRLGLRKLRGELRDLGNDSDHARIPR